VGCGPQILSRLAADALAGGRRDSQVPGEAQARGMGVPVGDPDHLDPGAVGKQFKEGCPPLPAPRMMTLRTVVTRSIWRFIISAFRLTIES